MTICITVKLEQQLEEEKTISSFKQKRKREELLFVRNISKDVRNTKYEKCKFYLILLLWIVQDRPKYVLLLIKYYNIRYYNISAWKIRKYSMILWLKRYCDGRKYFALMKQIDQVGITMHSLLFLYDYIGNYIIYNMVVKTETKVAKTGTSILFNLFLSSSIRAYCKCLFSTLIHNGRHWWYTSRWERYFRRILSFSGARTVKVSRKYHESRVHVVIIKRNADWEGELREWKRKQAYTTKVENKLWASTCKFRIAKEVKDRKNKWYDDRCNATVFICYVHLHVLSKWSFKGAGK